MSSLLIIFMFVIFRFKIMASFSPLVAILNQNKLTGKEIWILFLLLKSTNMCLLNHVLAFHH